MTGSPSVAMSRPTGSGSGWSGTRSRAASPSWHCWTPRWRCPHLPAPAALDDAQAGVLWISYQTSWFALHRRAALQAGETFLVHAAAGGVGSLAVQVGKAAGARVVAVVGGERKAEMAARLGADVLVDRHREDLRRCRQRLHRRTRADVVYDRWVVRHTAARPSASRSRGAS